MKYCSVCFSNNIKENESSFTCAVCNTVKNKTVQEKKYYISFSLDENDFWWLV